MTFTHINGIITGGGSPSMIDFIILTAVVAILYCCSHYGEDI